MTPTVSGHLRAETLRVLRVQALNLLPVLALSALCLRVQDVSSQLPVPAAVPAFCCPVPFRMDSHPSGTMSQINSSTGCLAMVFDHTM